MELTSVPQTDAAHLKILSAVQDKLSEFSNFYGPGFVDVDLAQTDNNPINRGVQVKVGVKLPL